MPTSTNANRRSPRGVPFAAAIAATTGALWLALATSAPPEFRPVLLGAFPFVAPGVLFVAADSAVRSRSRSDYFFAILVQLPIVGTLIVVSSWVIVEWLQSSIGIFVLVEVLFGCFMSYGIGFCWGLAHALIRGRDKYALRFDICRRCCYRIGKNTGSKCPGCGTRLTKVA